MPGKRSPVTEEMRAAFGKWMKLQHIALMQKLGTYLDKKDLAEKLEMERATVGKYLEGEIIPSGDGVIHLANFFGNHEIYDILGYEVPQLSQDQLIEQVVAHVKDGDFLEKLDRAIATSLTVK